jgi:hypothetical protein
VHATLAIHRARLVAAWDDVRRFEARAREPLLPEK